MLTGETALEKKTEGIEAGADNYLTKPIDSAELILWVEALLRRSSGDYAGVPGMSAGELTIDPDTRWVTSEGKPVSGLTDKEYRLLLELFRARPKEVSREDLIERLWGGSRTSNTLEFHVNTLRKKLGAQSASRLVTVRGVGYRLE
jgi:DNA-binding response OmpR family regulator